MNAARDTNWPTLVEGVAQIADVDPSTITADTRLIQDLGLDSLAITELLALAIAAYPASRLATDFESVEWMKATVGTIHAMSCQHVPARPS